MATIFSPGPWTGASGENVSPRTTGLSKYQQWSGVSVGKLHFSLFLLKEPIAGTLRHAYKSFAQVFEDLAAYGHC